MTIENKFNLRTVLATADLTADTVLFKAVSLNGVITNDINLAAGILRSKGGIGQGVSVVYQGLTKADVAIAVSTIGFPLKITTSGWVTVAASGDKVCGRALSTASSGDRIHASVDFAAVQNWGG